MEPSPHKFKGVLVNNPSGFRGLVGLKHDAAGRLCATGRHSKNLTSATCGSRAEAAAARDLLHAWALQQYGLDAAEGEYNHPFSRYARFACQPPLMERVAACRATADALVKQLRDSGGLQLLAGTLAEAPLPAPALPAAAATAPTALAPAAAAAAPAPASASNPASPRAAAFRGSRELKRLLHGRQDVERQLLREDQPEQRTTRKRTRRQRQTLAEAGADDDTAGLSLLLLRGRRPGPGGGAHTDDEEWTPSPKQRRQLQQQGGQAQPVSSPRGGLRQPPLPLQEAQEEEALQALCTLAGSPHASPSAAAAAAAGALPAFVVQRSPGFAPPAVLWPLGSPTRSSSSLQGDGGSSTAMTGQWVEKDAAAAAAAAAAAGAVDSGWQPSSTVLLPAQQQAAHEAERQRQLRLLGLLERCIQAGLARQQQQQQQQQAQSPVQPPLPPPPQRAAEHAGSKQHAPAAAASAPPGWDAGAPAGAPAAAQLQTASSLEAPMSPATAAAMRAAAEAATVAPLARQHQHQVLQRLVLRPVLAWAQQRQQAAAYPSAPYPQQNQAAVLPYPQPHQAAGPATAAAAPPQSPAQAAQQPAHSPQPQLVLQALPSPSALHVQLRSPVHLVPAGAAPRLQAQPPQQALAGQWQLGPPPSPGLYRQQQVRPPAPPVRYQPQLQPQPQPPAQHQPQPPAQHQPQQPQMLRPAAAPLANRAAIPVVRVCLRLPPVQTGSAPNATAASAPQPAISPAARTPIQRPLTAQEHQQQAAAAAAIAAALLPHLPAAARQGPGPQASQQQQQ